MGQRPFQVKQREKNRALYLQSNLLIHSNRSVAEGNGVTEAALSLDCPLGRVHNDL